MFVYSATLLQINNSLVNYENMKGVYLIALLVSLCGFATINFSLLEYKYSFKKSAVMIGIYAVIMMIANSVMILSYGDNITVFFQSTLVTFVLITTVACIFLSRWSITKTIFAALVGVTVSIMVMHISYLIVEVVLRANVNGVLLIIVITVLSYITAVFLYYKVRETFIKSVNALPKDWGWNALIALSQILVHTMFFNSVIEKTWRHYLVVIAMNVVVIFAYKLLFYNIQKVQSEEHDKMNNTMYKTQVRMMQDQVQATREAENIMRIARHDMKHYGGVIKTLLESGEVDKAMEYLDFINTSADASITKVYSKNPIINACLVYYDKKARREDISVELNINVPESSDSKDMEFVAVLSNAFENAINASSKEEDVTKRKIDIYVDKNEDRLLVEVKNNYVGEVVFNREGVPQSKNGVGIISIKEFVKKYGADLRFQTEGDTFILQMILIIT